MSTDSLTAAMNLGAAILVFTAAILTTIWPVFTKKRNALEKERIKEILIAVMALGFFLGGAFSRFLVHRSGWCLIFITLYLVTVLYGFGRRKQELTRGEIVFETIIPLILFFITIMLALHEEALALISK